MALAASIYERLPPFGRDLAASARGFQLRVTRYDRDLEARVEAALERERWTAGEWAAELERRTETALAAARSTPYYGDRLRDPSVGLREIASTPKRDLRARPLDFLVPRFPEKVVVDRTSGTSGTPLEITYDREAVREWFSLTEARLKRWHGVSRADRWAMFGGQVVVPVGRSAPPFWVHNRPMRQLYVSTHHLSRTNAPAIAAALRRFRPRYLLGYPSSMALFARFALEEDLQLPKVDVVLSNAEVLTGRDREVLEAAFSAPVRNSYGMAEALAGASECEHGTMHLWPEVGIVEVVAADGTVSADGGVEGPLALTGLLNRAMPLLRYEIGDVGSPPTSSSCPCGRTLPVLGEIKGRSSDFIVTPDGRHVFWMNPVFTGLPVVEAQFVQEDRGRVEVVLVAQERWGERHEAMLVQRCRARLGDDIEIKVRFVESIQRDPSGKFRPVVSHVGAA